ncbi:hypothetical protein CHUAL_011510, partial [Chamberlinius hualienensis]
EFNYKIPVYLREKDPLFRLAMTIRPDESETTTRKELERPIEVKKQVEMSTRSKQKAVDGTSESQQPAEQVNKKFKPENLVTDSQDNLKVEARKQESTIESEVKVEAEDDKSTEVSQENKTEPSSVNPGWFGKGYRKTVKRRKRKRVD